MAVVRRGAPPGRALAPGEGPRRRGRREVVAGERCARVDAWYQTRGSHQRGETDSEGRQEPAYDRMPREHTVFAYGFEGSGWFATIARPAIATWSRSTRATSSPSAPRRSRF